MFECYEYFHHNTIATFVTRSLDHDVYVGAVSDPVGLLACVCVGGREGVLPRHMLSRQSGCGSNIHRDVPAGVCNCCVCVCVCYIYRYSYYKLKIIWDPLCVYYGK